MVEVLFEWSIAIAVFAALYTLLVVAPAILFFKNANPPTQEDYDGAQKGEMETQSKRKDAV